MGKEKTKVKEFLPLILGLVLILTGLTVYLYPKLANRLYERDVSRGRENFLREYSRPADPEAAGETATEPTEDPRLEALYEYLKQENEALYRSHQNKLTDPFAYEQTAVDLSEYGLQDNTIGYITIEKMNVVLPILLGASVENMRVGAVHLTETSYPIGGTNCNCVIAAHRGARTQEMFRNIQVLEKGDRIVIDNFREKLTYEVCELDIIEPSDVGTLLIQEGRDLVTLLTCHPLGISDHRYVVVCQRVTEEDAG